MIKGIDASYAQGKVNWQRVKADGVSFAFLRAGYGWDNDKQIDKQFQNNVDSCKAVGMPYGVYHYSYARTAADARKEAKFCVRLMEKVGAEPSLPVVYDLEEKFQLAMSAKQQLDMIEAFCEEIETAGYRPMLYMSASPLNALRAYDAKRLEQWPIWVAHYGVAKPSYKGEWVVWQHTGTGKVDGIAGNVDLNWAEEEFWLPKPLEGDELKRLQAVITEYEAERNKVMYLVEEAEKLLAETRALLK